MLVDPAGVFAAFESKSPWNPDESTRRVLPDPAACEPLAAEATMIVQQLLAIVVNVPVSDVPVAFPLVVASGVVV